jgi:GNAT superfamily N-acetyltransferase
MTPLSFFCCRRCEVSARLGGAVIREVTRKEAERVAELFGQLWPDKGIEEEHVGSIIERYRVEPGYWIYGYEDGGTLCGLVTVSFRCTFFHDGEVASIEDLVVDEARRSEGIGAALVEFVEHKVVDDGRARGIEVISDLYREDAHSFWEMCGYSRLAFQFRKEMC